MGTLQRSISMHFRLLVLRTFLKHPSSLWNNSQVHSALDHSFNSFCATPVATGASDFDSITITAIFDHGFANAGRRFG